MKDQLQFLFVPRGALDLWWPQVSGLLTKCPETWQDCDTLESIYGHLDSGFTNLMIATEKAQPKVRGAALFQVRNYSETRILHIHWCYGSGIYDYLDQFLATMEDFAHKAGLGWVEVGPARRGFLPNMRQYGYGAERIFMKKKIDVRTLQ